MEFPAVGCSRCGRDRLSLRSGVSQTPVNQTHLKKSRLSWGELALVSFVVIIWVVGFFWAAGLVH